MDVNRLKNIKDKRLEVAELNSTEYKKLEEQIDKFAKENTAAFGIFDDIKKVQNEFIHKVETLSDDALQEMMEYYTEKDYWSETFTLRMEFLIPDLRYYFSMEEEHSEVYKKSINLTVDNYTMISFGYYPIIKLVQFYNDISNIKYSCYASTNKKEKSDNIFEQFIANLKDALVDKELKYQTGTEDYTQGGYFLQNYSLFDNQSDFMDKIIDVFVKRLEEFGCQILDVSAKEQKSDTYYITIKNPMYE